MLSHDANLIYLNVEHIWCIPLFNFFKALEWSKVIDDNRKSNENFLEYILHTTWFAMFSEWKGCKFMQYATNSRFIFIVMFWHQTEFNHFHWKWFFFLFYSLFYSFLAFIYFDSLLCTMTILYLCGKCISIDNNNFLNSLHIFHWVDCEWTISFVSQSHH